MKRLTLLLILAVFFFGISGGGVGLSNAKLQICAHPPHCPHYYLYLPLDDLSGSWDGADQPALPSGHFAFCLEPSWHHAAPGDHPRQLAQKFFCQQGLGCGGLPS